MKIKVGRYYQDRNGHPVYIYATKVKSTYPVKGIVVYPDGELSYEAYKCDGRFYNASQKSVLDLVRELPKHIDRPGIPKFIIDKARDFL